MSRRLEPDGLAILQKPRRLRQVWLPPQITIRELDRETALQPNPACEPSDQVDTSAILAHEVFERKD